jgi:hypothetical protein
MGRLGKPGLTEEISSMMKVRAYSEKERHWD